MNCMVFLYWLLPLLFYKVYSLKGHLSNCEQTHNKKHTVARIQRSTELRGRANAEQIITTLLRILDTLKDVFGILNTNLYLL